jgi:hypothetical protein
MLSLSPGGDLAYFPLLEIGGSDRHHTSGAAFPSMTRPFFVLIAPVQTGQDRRKGRSVSDGYYVPDALGPGPKALYQRTGATRTSENAPSRHLGE